MVRLVLAGLPFIVLAFFSGPLAWAGQKPVRELRVLTYDSLTAQEGLGPVLFSGFEKKCGCRVKVQVAGDAVQMLSRLELEQVRDKPVTQVVLGIDSTLWPQASRLALDLGVVLREVPEVKNITDRVVPRGFIPMDWGVLALMSRVPAQAISWRALVGSGYRKRFILQDPRTSTPGFAFVWGAEQALGDGASYFSALRQSWLTLAPGWSAAYGLFLNHEAPMVWSYSTSQAYHASRGEQGFKAVMFKEGNPIQVEGAFAVRSALLTPEDRELARSFLQHLVSLEVQSEIPLRQWMFPVIEGVRLPEVFRDLPRPVRALTWDPMTQDYGSLVRRWEGWIRR